MQHKCVPLPSEYAGEAIVAAQDQAFRECQNLDDQEQAKTILVNYCASKGYTAIVSLTVLPSTGASTVTETAAAATRTIYLSKAFAVALHTNSDWLKYLPFAVIFVVSMFSLECVMFLRGLTLTPVPVNSNLGPSHRKQPITRNHDNGDFDQFA